PVRTSAEAKYTYLPSKTMAKSTARSAALLLLQQQLSLFLDQGLGLLGHHGQEPGQLDLDAYLVFRDVDPPAGRMAQQGDPQVEMIARPVLLQHGEMAAERGPGALQARLQAALGLLPTQVVGNDNDDRLRHERQLLLNAHRACRHAIAFSKGWRASGARVRCERARPRRRACARPVRPG